MTAALSRSSKAERLSADRGPAITSGTVLSRPLRVGAISNPQSGRNTREKVLRSVRDVLEGYPGLRHHEVNRHEDIAAAARELADAENEILVVNGGDGTVQAVLTVLLTEFPGRPMPVLAILPGGTTNMTAGDVNGGRRSPRQLKQVLDAARTGRLLGPVVERPIMRVERSPKEGPMFGMFFGAGAVYHGIRFCRQRIHSLGVKGETGPGLALAVFVLRVISGRGGALFPPLHVHGAIDGVEEPGRAYFGILASTLRHLFLGLQPFWGEGSGRMRYTALRRAPHRPLRAAVPFMRGKPTPGMRPELGYDSRNVNELQIHLDSGFTLDGELFAPLPGRPVELSAGETGYFLAVGRR